MRLILDRLRAQAGVGAFDQALTVCVQGKRGLRVSIMNIRDNFDSAWVQDEKSKAAFWLPKTALDRR